MRTGLLGTALLIVFWGWENDARGQCVTTEEAKIVASDGVDGDAFGFSVSVSGDVLVVGAIGSCSAYVYRSSGSTWVEHCLR